MVAGFIFLSQFLRKLTSASKMFPLCYCCCCCCFPACSHHVQCLTCSQGKPKTLGAWSAPLSSNALIGSSSSRESSNLLSRILWLLLQIIPYQSHAGGAGIACWQSERLQIRIPAGAAGEFSSPGLTLRADSYSGVRSTPCDRSGM